MFNHELLKFVLALYLASIAASLLIQLGVLPPDTVRVLSPTLAGHVSLDVGPLRDSLNQLEHAVVLARLAQRCHSLWECELGSMNTLI